VGAKGCILAPFLHPFFSISAAFTRGASRVSRRALPDTEVPYQYLTCPVSAAGIGSEGPTVVGLRFMDSVGSLLLTSEPRAGGGATGGEDYVAVGIETLDC